MRSGRMKEHHGESLHPRFSLVQGAGRGLGLALVTALLERTDVERVVATAREPGGSAGLAALAEREPGRLLTLPLDVRDETSLESAAKRTALACPRLHLLVNCAGILHDGEHLRPERRLEDVELESLRRSFEVNAFGALLVAKHFHRLLRHDERAVLANVSARVGSIGDNRLGGWYAYRASKAALNMLTKTLALELGRRARNTLCVALHPGTVDTDLSRPFQRALPASQIFTPERAARQLLDVVERLTPEQSGSFLAWDGTAIPW